MKYGQFALHRIRQIYAAMLVVGLLLPISFPAFAVKAPGHLRALTTTAGGQAFACTATPTASTITIGTVSIVANTPNGPIGTPVNTSVSVSCTTAFSKTPNYYDNFTVETGQLATLDPSAPTGVAGLMFQTNLPGLDVELTASLNQAASGNNGPNGTPGWAIGTIDCNYANSQYNCSPTTVSVTYTAQLYKTGPVSPGTVNSIALLQLFDTDNVPPTAPAGWNITTYSSASPEFGTLTLQPITVSMTTCSVTTASQNTLVTLPTVISNTLNSVGSVAGNTAFNIQYSCPSKWSLYMTMSTATPGSASGVILSPASCTSGASATNVGVQVLQGDNVTPVTFNVAQSLGNSSSGTSTFTVPYYAQYYATGLPVGAGPVCATATFNMSYQ